jgi:hypothetical protein
MREIMFVGPRHEVKAYALALKMEVTCFSKISVDSQQTAWLHILEDRTFHTHHCENLKFYKCMWIPVPQMTP